MTTQAKTNLMQGELTTLFADEPIFAPRDATLADSFQTPNIAVKPLLPFLRRTWRVWEPCCGGGNIVLFLQANGFCVFGTDILEPHGRDFLTWSPGSDSFDALITNPPYSKGDDFLERAYQFRKPFAFLLPVSYLGGKRRQNLFREYGVEVILLGERINFRTPTGKSHGSGSSANFETAWFCGYMNIGRQLTFSTL